MVKVPEGYLLLKPMDTSRPALFVMDGDGNRVTSISLEKALDGALDPKDLAKAIEAAKTADATTRYVYEGTPEQISKLKKEIEEGAKVSFAGEIKVSVVPRKAGVERLEFRTRPGSFAPLTRWEGAELVDPVPVGTTAKDRTFHSAMLLHPKTLGKAAWDESGFVLHKFEFHNLPKGATALNLFRLPMPMKGVLAVHPDLDNDAIAVVGRKNVVDFAAIGNAFTTAGHEPFEEETDGE